MDHGDLINRFTFHPADRVKAVLHENIRDKALELALYLDTALPEGREKSLAITHLEEVMMWSNASVARNN